MLDSFSYTDDIYSMALGRRFAFIAEMTFAAQSCFLFLTPTIFIFLLLSSGGRYAIITNFFELPRTIGVYAGKTH